MKQKILQWAGHVQRMEGRTIPKKILDNAIGSMRRVGKPMNRWIDAKEEDSRKILGTRKDKNGWRRWIKEAKIRHRAVVL